MASKPGILTEWPWTPLGSFKYIVLAPWAIHSTYTFITKGEKERDLTYFLIFPYLLVRILHDQIWISLSRYRNAKGSNKIVDKSIEFEQVDRESNWDDQILFNGLLFYIGYTVLDNAKNMPIWRTDGVIITSLLHSGPVEFLYYWLHRALHHHFLYSRYHSHHHSSIITEPITSVIHPFAEHIAYFILFAIPLLTTIWTKTASIASFSGYIFYIDFMNNMGHCNFELIPKWLFTVFPPLKYIMYTPSFHSLHHTQFRTNYCLFMPFYDYLYGTTDKSTDNVYETSLKRREESPDVVHLTHLTTPESVYHLRSGFAAVASKPFTSTWYLWMLWPFTLWSVFITWIYGLTFISESNTFKNLKLQTWVVPRYNIQYLLPWRKESINGMIERAILDADIKGVKVLTLGLQNQGEEINGYGELFIRKQPNLKVKLVDGSSLAIALILNNIPKETAQVLLRGNLTKVACVVANSLCERGIKVATLNKEEHEKLKLIVDPQFICNLVISKAYTDKIWLVGERWNEEEQMKATNGTTFIPFSQFPPKKMRKDCVYYSTPAMIIPDSFKNMHSCENWLPRRVMSAWRIAGIVHGLEGWNTHETGKTVFSIEKIWEASLQHGFQPYMTHV